MKIYLLTLGCPKNEVDSEGMVSLLASSGHTSVADPQEADVLIVNTCAFIESSREESLEHLRRLATLKRRTARQSGGKLLVAAGCLSERYSGELLSAVPEIDAILGTLRWSEIDRLLAEADGGNRPCWTGTGRAEGRPSRIIGGPSAYLKIADGCDASCAFCAIPSIKGPQRSKPADAIIAEARQLARLGVKEIVLIAQDTTAYGGDLGARDGLPVLLERLVFEVPDVPWYRIMYAYPAHVSDRLIEVMASQARIVKYLDIPLQHAHPDVLKRMRRPLNGAQVVARLRAAMPEIALRSAFIAGYPGETEAEFQALLAFLDEVCFDRVGMFSYSREDGTEAAALGPVVPAKTVRARYARAMARQQRISLARNRTLVGRTLEVLVEGERPTESLDGEKGNFHSVGRSYRDAPEVDGLVFVKQTLPPGTIAKVRITAALPYDLAGEKTD